MSRLAVWWRNHLGAALIAGAAAALVIAAAFIWPITDLIAAHDVDRIVGPHRAAQLQTAREAVRTQLLTLAAGVFVAGALWFTAQNFRLSRQGQVTDRYIRAIEQLGSDKLDVRIGAIYALERIARDSVTDQPTVMEVLAAFIREHSQEERPPPAHEPSADSERGPRPDVQAAFNVIARRNPRHDRQDDVIVEMPGLRMITRHGPSLFGADLSNTSLNGANLTGADLSDANLHGANLIGANLTNTYLRGVDLTDAFLPMANLSGANLDRANLTNASLTGADLSDANLTDAVFNGAQLDGATFAEDQPVPDGWLRDPGSGRLRRVGRDANDTG